MATASKKPVFVKLGIKEGHRTGVINAPKELKIPSSVKKNPKLNGEYDLLLFFATRSAGLSKKLRDLKKVTKKDGKIWVAWQKGHATDLSRDSIWKIGDEVGLDSVASCSIDAIWSAMKLMYPKGQRA